jgi:hypothetical protein
MAKSKTYRYGKTICKANLKTVGLGWEVSFYFDGKPLFVGNFVHANEASKWWGFMNKELTAFSRKYTTGYKFPVTWFSHFLKNHLYTQYYGWLDKVFVAHQKSYGKAFLKDFRKFKATKKNYASIGAKKPFLKAA